MARMLGITGSFFPQPPAMAQMTNPTSSSRGATGALPEEFVPDSRLFRR